MPLSSRASSASLSNAMGAGSNTDGSYGGAVMSASAAARRGGAGGRTNAIRGGARGRGGLPLCGDECVECGFHAVANVRGR